MAIHVNTGKDGAVAAVDGRLFHTGIHRENKRAVVLNNSSTKAGERLYFILWDFPLVQEVLKDNSRRAKRLNYSYLLLAEFSVRTVNYGPSLRTEKTRLIRCLLYGFFLFGGPKTSAGRTI